MDKTEIIISKIVSEKLFDDIGEYIQNKMGGDLIKSLDGLDQKYFDYRLPGGIVTLHWEQYLGISVFGNSSKEVIEYLNEVKNQFSNN